MNLTFSRCARVSTAAFTSVFAMVEIIPNFHGGTGVRPIWNIVSPWECGPGRTAMKSFLRGRSALGAAAPVLAALVLGALLAGATSAQAQGTVAQGTVSQ